MQELEYEGYIVSLGEVLRDLILEAKKNKDDSVGKESEEFNTGYLSAYHRIVTLMQQQAEIYEIPLEKIGLEGFEESDLI